MKPLPGLVTLLAADALSACKPSRGLVNWETAMTVPIPASGWTRIDPAAATEPFLFCRAVLAP